MSLPAISLVPQFVTNEKGERTAVILSMEQFEAILDALEDIEDAKAVEEARSLPSLPHEAFMSELRADGLLPD